MDDVQYAQDVRVVAAPVVNEYLYVFGIGTEAGVFQYKLLTGCAFDFVVRQYQEAIACQDQIEAFVFSFGNRIMPVKRIVVLVCVWVCEGHEAVHGGAVVFKECK